MLIASAALLAANAQSVPGSLTGQVRDALGAVIAGAEVQLWSEKEPEKVLRGETNDSGTYAFQGLQAGDYSLKVVSPGFNRLTVAQIHIPASEGVSLPDLTLSVGYCIPYPWLDHIRFLPAGHDGGDLAGSVELVVGPLVGNTAPASDVDIVLCGEAPPAAPPEVIPKGGFFLNTLVPGRILSAQAA